MFRFPLQRVLELRAHRRDVEAARLAAAQAEQAKARSAREDLEALRREGLAAACADRTGSVPAGFLQGIHALVGYMDECLDAAREASEQAAAEVGRCLDSYHDASREHRVLERLREKQRSAWQAEEARLDLKEMDSIALTRFVRIDAEDR
jgi:flagellar FliJ protein